MNYLSFPDIKINIFTILGGDYEQPEYIKQHCRLHQISDTSSDAKDIKTIFIQNLSRNIFILLIVILLLLITIIPLFYLYYIVPKQICDEQSMLNWPSHDCRGDGFYDMNYYLNNSCGVNIKRYVRYKFVDDIVHDTMYNFSSAKKQCEHLGATLWEVLDGEPEWSAFIAIAKALLRSNLWLNAKVIGKCDVNSTIKDVDSNPSPRCNENEASDGHGLDVSWPTTHYHPKYSRLIRGLTDAESNDDTLNSDENCVFVDNNNHHLWDTHDCSSKMFWGLCVKRRCLWPEHQGPE